MSRKLGTFFKRHLLSLLFGIVLGGFTLYLVLDTFVITSTYQKNATQMNTDLFEGEEEDGPRIEYGGYEKKLNLTGPNKRDRKSRSSDYYKGDWGNTAEVTNRADLTEPLTYEDEKVRITVTEYVEYGTHIYVADIQTSSAQYLKTAFAEDTYGRNITAPTSEIAEEHEAILAINGDYYGARWSGYVIRNGILYRDEESDDAALCIYADGTMKIIDQNSYTAEELIEDGVWQTLCFGPGLIENGEIIVSEEDEVGRAKASNPRTAIGEIAANHYLFVVSDGRTDDSEGLSLRELAEFMLRLGAVTAYNLDGGGSSTMVFNGLVVNNPTAGMSISERSVSDIVYIG